MTLEVLSAIVILGIALLFLNPGHLSMPESVNSMLVVGLILAFIVFSAFILKEKSSDEREALHKFQAGRISYLFGIGTLTLGVIIQALNHNIDTWLVFSLCVMVFSKIASRIYLHIKK